MQPAAGNIICPSCGAVFTGTYCANCGEKKVTHHDFTLQHLAEETVESFTHFDNKFFRSLKLLILKPGLLACYYFEGRRVPYMKPLQLFIVCNLIFFLLLHKTNIFSLPLSTYYQYSNYTYFGTKEVIDAKIHNDPKGVRLAAIFNEKMIVQSKAFVVLFIPLFTLFCAVAFLNKRTFFAAHVVFSMHFLAFILVYFIAFRFVIEWPFSRILHFTDMAYNQTFDIVSSWCNIGVLAFYGSVAAKRFYQTSRTQAVVCGGLMGIVFLIGLFAYRLFLFYKISYAID